MGRQSLDPWLVSLLGQEIEAVTAWRRSNNSGIKPDPDSRFSDDGSNFRSVISSPPSERKLLVQLHEVLSVGPDTVVILSDGETRIKTRLSRSAIATLAAETPNDTFDYDVKGDIIELIHFTLVATPFGPSDGFIQLVVETIEWVSLSRKLIGKPKPIEDEGEIRALLDEVRLLLCPSSQATDISETTKVGTSPVHLKGAQVSSPVNGNEQDRPTASIQQSTSASYPASQHNQSQIPGARIQRKPTLAHDGFEVQSGVNLHRPSQPGEASSVRHNNVSQPPSSSTNLMRKLGSLLSKRRYHEEEHDEQNSLGRRDVVLVSEPLAKATDEQNFPDPTFTSPRQPHSDDGTESLPHSTSVPSNNIPPSAQQPPKESTSLPQSSDRPATPLRYYKIPSNQKKLLDKPESWFPSLPGQRFPMPNVPIELLDQWRKAATDKPSPHQSSQQDPEPRSAQRASAPEVEDDHISWSESDGVAASSSDEDAEPFSASQWPPSPAHRKMELPPDSSSNTFIRGTQQEDLEIDVPKTLPIRKTPTKIPHAGHPLPKKPAISPPVYSPSFSSNFLPLSSFHSNNQRQSGSRALDHFPSSLTKRQLPIPDDSDHGRPGLPAQSNSLGTQTLQSQAIDTSKESENMTQKSPASPRQPHQNTANATTKHSAPEASTPTAPRAMRDAGRKSRGDDSSPSTLSSAKAVSQSAGSTQSRSSGRRAQIHSSPTASARHLESPFRDRPMVGRNPSLKSKPFEAPGPLTKSPPNNGSLEARRAPSNNDHSIPHDNPPTPSTPHNHLNVPAQRSDQEIPEHPDERHRRIRKDYLAKVKDRRDWLQANFTVRADGPLRFQDVLHRYRAAHPHDPPLEAQDFDEAVRRAFPDASPTAPLRMSFADRADRGRRAPGHMPDRRGIAIGAGPDEEEEEEPVRDRDGDGDGRGVAAAAAREMQMEETSEMEETEQKENALREFAHAWLQIEPGGHFALERADRRRGPGRRGVDVLAWEE